MRTATLDRPERLAGARRRLAAARHRRHPAAVALMIAGAAALAWSAEIHFRLWADGYRHIPTIGPLFLMQGVVAALLALVLLGTRTVVAAAAGVLFLLSTIGGLMLSDWVGLFGFHDHLDAPFAGMSLAVEGAGAAVLVVAVALQLRRR